MVCLVGLLVGCKLRMILARYIMCYTSLYRTLADFML